MSAPTLHRPGDTGTWDVPTPDTSLDAMVVVPGSKSQTARALVLAALANEPSTLRHPLEARDTMLMAQALRQLGCQVIVDDDQWRVVPGGTPASDVQIDVGNSGTVTRFLPAAAALTNSRVDFDGDPRIRERPVGPLLTSLRELGVELDDQGRGALPITVRGKGGFQGGETRLDASTSSQLISGLLLAAPRSDTGVTVTHVGPPVPSLPYLAMTVAELRRFGATVEVPRPDVWRVEPGPLTGINLTIEPDLSSATPFLCAALVAGGTVSLAGWPTASTQPGMALPELLQALGADVELTDAGLRVTGGPRINGIDVDLHEFGEAVPVLTAVALFADGPSRLRGVAHLRAHETDRLLALAEEFGKLGADVRDTEDGVTINPRTLHPAELDPRADHRLAMAYAVAGLRVPGLRVRDAATVAKTVPDFRERWSAMLGDPPLG